MGLSLEKIDKIVGRETHLKDIDLELAPGSRNVILGRTLAGKTSLLRIMAGLDQTDPGPGAGEWTGCYRHFRPQAQRRHGLPAIHQLPFPKRL